MSFFIFWVMFGLFGQFNESLGAVTHTIKLNPKTIGESDCPLNYYKNDTMILRRPTFKDCKYPIQPAFGQMISSDAQGVAPLNAPWIVALYLKDDTTYICAGTLIMLDLVLTAAHCLYNKNNTKIKESDVSIRFLKPYLGNTPNSDFRNVKGFRIHQWYKNDHLNQFDVAFILLVRKIPVLLDQEIVCLPWFKDVSLENPHRTSGGLIYTWKVTQNQTLGVAPFQYHSEGSTADIFNIETSAQLCAGDSGSPVVVNCRTRDWECKCLIGVVSRVTRSVTKCAKDITVTNLTYYAIETFIRELEENFL